MDIFTLEWTGEQWAGGDLVNGIKEVTWVERYDTPGQLTIKAEPHHDILYRLQPDTLVSHTNTNEVMIIEEVEIEEEFEEEAVVTITGRSLFGFFDERVATDEHQGFHNTKKLDDGSAGIYMITGWPEHTRTSQLRNLIQVQIQVDKVDDAVADFAIPGVTVTFADGMDETNLFNLGGWSIDVLPVKRQNLLKAVTEVLKEERWGLKIFRPNWFAGQLDNIVVQIHEGTDRTDTVQFSYDAGDLMEAKYFKTNRGKKNALFVSSRYAGSYYAQGWVDIVYPFDRRVGQLSANDIRANPNDYGWAGMSVWNRMVKIFNRRARWTLRDQETPTLLEAKLNRGITYRYRKDYEIGDIVHVQGNYGFQGSMRIIEYVETFDEDGEDGYPVLEAYEAE